MSGALPGWRQALFTAQASRHAILVAHTCNFYVGGHAIQHIIPSEHVKGFATYL